MIDLVAEAAFDMIHEQFGYTPDDLTGQSRAPRLVRAREWYAYALRTNAQYSMPEIAESLGSRNHTTILAALRRVDRRRVVSADYRKSLDKFVKEHARRMRGRVVPNPDLNQCSYSDLRSVLDRAERIWGPLAVA